MNLIQFWAMKLHQGPDRQSDPRLSTALDFIAAVREDMNVVNVISSAAITLV